MWLLQIELLFIARVTDADAYHHTCPILGSVADMLVAAEEKKKQKCLTVNYKD